MSGLRTLTETTLALDNNELDRIALLHDRKRKFVLFSEIRANVRKDWLVHGLLGAREASTVYGAPGCGKSVMVEDMALHVAAGWEWHGRQIGNGAVLYVALERRALIERRALAFRKKHGVENLPFAIAGGVMDFRNPATAKDIAEICRLVSEETGVPVVLVVIDTLSRALCGGDENSPKDMGAVVTATAQMQAATGAHIMWIHHMPHDGDRMRGHGALLGAMDTTIHVTKGAAIRTATVIKANDSEEGVSVSFNLESIEIGDDGTTAPIVIPAEKIANATTEPKLTKNQQTLFAMLHTAGGAGLSLEEWNRQARDAGIGVKRKADLNDIRNALLSKGLVRSYGDRWTVCHGG